MTNSRNKNQNLSFSTALLYSFISMADPEKAQLGVRAPPPPPPPTPLIFKYPMKME